MSEYTSNSVQRCPKCYLFACRCGAETNDTPDTDFGQVITMDARRFAERVFRKTASSIAHVKNNLDSYENYWCPAILGPEVLDILEACDVMRAKLDDPELAECLSATESRDARNFLTIVERVRGDLLTLTRSGDFPEDGVVVVLE